MTIHRFTAIALALLLLALAPRLIGGGADADAEPSRTPPTPAALPDVQPDVQPDNAVAPVADRSELDRTIGVLETRLEAGDTYLDMRTLGTLYLARARIDADPADYAAADRTLTEVNERDPDDTIAATALAGARLARHDFAGARDLVASVTRTDAGQLDARAIEGDAALAVGDIEAAATAYAQLVGLLPDDPSVAVRSAELAWQTGDVATAIAETTRAVDLLESVAADDGLILYVLTYAANRNLAAGDAEAAATLLERAATVAPDDPGVLHGLGQVAAHDGDLPAAVLALRDATNRRPDPAWLIDLAAAATAAGDMDLTADTIATIGATERLFGDDRAYRGAYARYHLRWGDPERALELTTAEVASRQDAASLMLHAQSLAATGALAQAQRVADQAVATGVRDAGLLSAAGTIAAAAGDEAQAASLLAAALDVDPAFHPLDALAASRLLADVGE